jgi:hypothetical protein
MSAQTFILAIVMVLLGMFVYSQYSWRGKVLCFFRRPNRTVVEKKVRLHSRSVTFQGGKYYIDPKRIDLMWYTRGLIHSMFPMFVPFLEFKHDSSVALDPTKFTNTWDTPEARASTREEEKFRNLSKGFDRQGGVKETFLSKWLPWIAIGLTLVIGYMVYQQSQQLAVLEQLIKVTK